ncbi:MAG TPA: multiheme c-type cytochrome [Chthonomonadaceae bacterium]|nr:multiheme c-type cytochrome [Chthonomonadaceae bacterium]
MPERFAIRCLLGTCALATAALLLAAGCAQRVPAARPQVVVAPATVSYVGNAVCGECHQAEFNSHRASRHALTLRAMNRPSLGSLAPPVGSVANTWVTIKRLGEGFGVEITGQPESLSPLDLAFGSGKTGMTYVAIVSDDTLAEVHTSYFPHERKWYVTPGQENAPDYGIGVTYRGATARRCLLCHATALPDNSLMPEKQFFGVGCESCHGPGSAHVAAMRAGDRAHLYTEQIGSWSATRINELCGRCHRTAQDVTTPTVTSVSSTHRFQAYGLMKSACFQNSHDTLSCLTCHNPHTNASTDRRTYEAACLGCHSPAQSARTASATRTVQGKTCPVNAHSGCIGCHMPRRKVFADTKVSTTMPDHFIRIYRTKS